ASAQVSRQIAAPGSTRVGMISGVAYAVTQPSGGGACTYINLGSGGLNNNYLLVGTTGADVVTFVQSNQTFCGHTVGPLVVNGKYVSVSGNDGNDWLQAGPGNSYAHGGFGNDALFSGFYTGTKTVTGSFG